MARIFLSYASENVDLARTVHEWLVADGCETFLAEDLRVGIRVGEDWQQRLHERLRWADALVCLITSAHLASTWCTAEIAIAQTRGCKLLPVLAEPGITHPLLTSVHHVALATDDRARAQLLAALRWVKATGPYGWSDGRPPFPGLRSFGSDEHQIYFGRECETAELAALLRSPAERADATVLAVVGPSGCGKSSLVRAGLLPLMRSDDEWWTVSAIVPGTDPFSALVRELTASARDVGLDWSVADVRSRLTSRGLLETADEILLADRRRQRLLVVVDQLEELVTLTAPGQRARFAGLLRPALSGPVRLVATLRPEFLNKVLLDPELSTLPIRIYPLRPLQRGALERAITGPTELAGISIEDQLADRLVDDTEGGEALPLLAYTLAELATGVGRGGRLSTSRYEQLGGVQGALRRQADLALADAVSMSGRTSDDVIDELLRLVTVDEAGRPTRWRIRRNDLSDVARQETDAFVARRLLITDNDNGSAVLSVAHESFLSAWAPLAEAISGTVTGLRARRAVEQAAAEWADDGRRPTRLWERGQLAACLSAPGVRLPLTPSRWPSPAAEPHAPPEPAHRISLSPLAEEFLRTSIRRDKRRRRRAITVLSALLVIALGAAAIAFSQQQLAETRQHVATARSFLTQAENNTDPRLAVRLGAAAVRTDSSAEFRAGLASIVLRNPFRRSLDTGSTMMTGLAVSTDGRILATADLSGTTTLWDFSDPVQPRRLGEPLDANAGTVFDIAFAPKGGLLACAHRNGSVTLWSVLDPTRPRPLDNSLVGHTGAVYGLSFSADGRVLATIGEDGLVILWDVADPATSKRVGTIPVGPITDAAALAFTPAGRILATTSNSGVMLWDLTDPTRPKQLIAGLPGLAEPVPVLNFSPDGHILQTSTGSASALWDVTDAAHPRRIGELMSAQTQMTTDAVFSRTGQTIAIANSDGTALVWDVRDPAQPRQLQQVTFGASRVILVLAFSADGRYLVTAGVDGTTLIWDLTMPNRPNELEGIAPAGSGIASSESTALAFSPLNRTLATAGADGVHLWDLNGSSPRSLTELAVRGNGPAAEVAFAPDGHVLAATAGQTAALWDIADPSHPRRLSTLELDNPSALTGLAFTPDGQLLTAVSQDGHVVLWRITDPARPIRIGEPLAGAPDANAVAIAPDGHTLAIATDSGTELWDIADSSRPHRLNALGGHANPVTDVAFATDGRTVATASEDRTTILWDVSNNAAPRRLGEPLTGHSGTVVGISFSPDGQTLATVSVDDTIRLWDLTDPAHLHQLGEPLPGRGNGLAAVAFSPDSRTIAAASNDGSVHLWDLHGINEVRADPLGQACAMTGRPLDRAEWDRYASDMPYVDSCA